MGKSVDVSISGSTISASPDPLLMGNQQSQEITWRITTSGWTFTAQGIQIYNADSQWTDKGTSAQGQQYKWHDQNSNAQTYGYAINVTNGTTTLNVDPAIINQGDGAY